LVLGCAESILDAHDVTTRGHHVTRSAPGPEQIEELGLRVDADLAKEVRKVIPHGAGAEIHGSGDLGHAFATEEPIDHLALARGEVLEAGDGFGIRDQTEVGTDACGLDFARDASEALFELDDPFSRWGRRGRVERGG